MHCESCGFVYEDVASEDVPIRLRLVPEAFAAHLGAPNFDVARLAERPSPQTWSTVEYGCHVRDVLIAQRERVLLALVEDHPAFAPMHRDERAVLAAYAEEPPSLVAAGIGSAAVLLAHLFEHLTADQLGRSCVYNYPEPAERDVLWIGRHTVHECHHHLADIRRAASPAR